MRCAVYLLVFLLSAIHCNGANILAIIPSPFYSHQAAHRPLWKELSSRGHKVTLITTHPMKNSSLHNLTEINLQDLRKTFYQKFNDVDVINAAEKITVELYNYIIEIHKFVAEEVLKDSAVQALIKNQNNQTFDVVFAEYLYPAVYAFAEIYKSPLISVSSMDVPFSLYSVMGNPTHPVMHPDLTILTTVPPLSFKERLISNLYQVLFTLYVEYIGIPEDDLIVKKYFGNNLSPLSDIRRRISLVFLNVDPVLFSVKPLVPTMIPVSYFNQIEQVTPLQKDLEDFINNTANGIIYFSLGSIVNNENIKPETLKNILEVFEELPYGVVWKTNIKVANNFKNVYTSPWLSQWTILQNHKTKLFITHGGLLSLQETIYSHVPVLGLPFFGNHFSNMILMVSKGVGLSLNHATMTKQEFKSAILEVVGNPRYRNNVKHLATLALDQPMTGLERAVWWTEFVIRNKGAAHLKGPPVDLPIYQYYHLDVIAFCTSVLMAITLICVKIFCLFIKIFKGKYLTKEKKH